jgi:hypothetical protein
MTWVKYPPHLLRVPAVPKTDPATETS